MATLKETNQSDSDDEDPEFSPKLHHPPPQPPVINLSVRRPRPNKNYMLSVHHTFSPSCVVVSSRIVVVVSLIFALAESFLFGMVLVSFYGLTGLLLVSCFVFVILLAGERYRINCSLKWWRNSTSINVESCRAYEVTTTWIKSTTLSIIFLIVPVWLASTFFVYTLSSMDEHDIPATIIAFVLVTGVDLIIFIPFIACPTAVYAAVSWKRAIKDEERMEYLRNIEA